MQIVLSNSGKKRCKLRADAIDLVREPRHVAIKDFSVPSLVLSHEPKFPEKVRRDIELLKYKFNVEYEKTIFDGPASRKVKATDWKPRKRTN